MTPQEALNTLDKTVIRNLELKIVLSNALEKQIPKKVTHEATKLKDCTCPSCGNVISEKVDYCKFCGQALDYEEKKIEKDFWRKAYRFWCGAEYDWGEEE